jgi:hypothetical protein
LPDESELELVSEPLESLLLVSDEVDGVSVDDVSVEDESPADDVSDEP